MAQKQPVVVLRSNDICYYGIISSLRDSAVPCISVIFDWEGSKPWFSEQSKAFDASITIANPYTDELLAVEQLGSFLKDQFELFGQKLLVIPSSDTNLMFIAEHWELWSEYISIMGNAAFDDPRMEIVHKNLCMEILNQGDEQYAPQSWSYAPGDSLEALVNSATFPVVYKPAVKDYGQSFYNKHNGLKAVECISADALLDALDPSNAGCFELVIQEKIIFDSVYDEIPFYLYADADSNIRMAANGIKEVIQPFPFGTATALRFSWNPELFDIAQKLVKKIAWRGILMIEFIKDKKDGCWKVIELNTRPWLFNGFYARLGFDFVGMLVQDYTGQLEKSDNVIVAKSDWAAINAVHVDLMTIPSHVEVSHGKSLNDFSDWLNDLGGRISSPYAVDDDGVPFGELKRILAESCDWPADELSNVINSSIKQQSIDLTQKYLLTEIYEQANGK